jgi:hypothetical protein
LNIFTGVRALLDAFRDALPFRYNDYQTKNPDLLSWLRNGVSDEARKLIKLNEGDSENSYWSSYVDMLDQAPFIHFALQVRTLVLAAIFSLPHYFSVIMSILSCC